jgi:uncharacterized protein
MLSPAPGATGVIFSGYCCLWDTYSRDRGGYVSIFRRGCFDAAFRGGHDTLCRGNHEERDELGRLRNGSLRLWADHIGLAYECHAGDCYIAHDLARRIETGTCRGSSFTPFDPADGREWVRDLGGWILEVRRVDRIIDVGPVGHPSIPGTTAHCRHDPLAWWRPKERMLFLMGCQ